MRIPVFLWLLILGAALPAGAPAEDSSSVTPLDVNVVSSGGGGLPTYTDRGYLELQLDWSNYSDSQVVDMGSHEVCMLSTVDWQFQSTDSYGRDMISMQMCEVYQSGGSFYLSAAGKIDTFNYDQDARVICQAVCYD